MYITPTFPTYYLHSHYICYSELRQIKWNKINNKSENCKNTTEPSPEIHKMKGQYKT